MPFRIPAFIYCLLLAGAVSVAQDKTAFKFDKVSAGDFNSSAPDFDSGAHAVIIADIGSSKMVPNKKGGFGYEFERKMRVKILDITGVDAGKFEIPVYYENNTESREELQQLKGVTYNLEGGDLQETKLENRQVFSERLNRYYQVNKFSMPALKAGSVFEISYKITSDFLFELRPWNFQGDFPCMYSEYKVEIPYYYDYVFLIQGYCPFFVSETSQVPRTFLIRDNNNSLLTGGSNNFALSGMVNLKRWVIKNIPSLKEEGFTTSLDNHRSKLEFQLSSVHFPNSEIQQIMSTWPKVAEGLMKREDFGEQLEKIIPWLDDVLDPIISGTKNQSEKARKIYSYLRDNYTCTNRNSIYTNNGLKSLLKTKNGNIAEINLLLTALLRQAGIEAYPVILSTRSHGITNLNYPLMDRFNYVVCAANAGESQYFLDASVTELAFGKLDAACYNGHARILTQDTKPVYLSPDSILERKVTVVFINPDDHRLTGSIQSIPGFYESLDHRHYIKEKGRDAFFGKIRSSVGSDYTIINTGIDSLNQLDLPVKFYYDLEMKQENVDLLYLDPILVNNYKENPFKSAERRYPVEMPYKIDESYILNFTIPNGYSVDELPKSARIKLNETDGYFEYLVSYNESALQLRTRLVLSKATFLPDEYEGLREFFGYVVKKQAEQLVLKKLPTK